MHHPLFGHVRLLSRVSAGGLGALGDDCAAILNEVYRLQKLAKTRSKKEHRRAATQLAAQAQQRYQQCIAAKAAATPVTPTPVTPTPVTPTPIAPAPVTPVPYVPYYGGGDGGGAYPEALPIMSPGYCANEQGVQVPCESLSTQPAATALTTVPYVQMPTGAEYGGAEMPTRQMPRSLPQVQYVEMPYGGETDDAQAGTIKEEDFVGQRGYAQYSDQWGPIKVIRLVIPKKATAQAVSGGQALPGGTMDIEQFTSEYALSGGWW